MGVSPVFVESEAEYLEEYGFLIKKGNKYLANIIIEGGEDADETIALQDKMYSDAAKLFTSELYDKLVDSGLLEDDGIESRYSSDKNYLIWALLPYITGFGGELNEEIAFEECATRRKDGSFDIPYAILQSDTEAKYESSLKKWCGPAWISRADTILWCCRSEWSEERDMQKYISEENLKLLLSVGNGKTLSVEQYASLAEQGSISMENGKATLCAVRLNKSINGKLLALGQAVREKCKTRLTSMKKDYVKAVLNATPPQLKKAAQYRLQYIFYADGVFLIYLLKELLSQGKLKLPKPEQRASLTTVIAPLN